MSETKLILGNPQQNFEGTPSQDSNNLAQHLQTKRQEIRGLSSLKEKAVDVFSKVKETVFTPQFLSSVSMLLMSMNIGATSVDARNSTYRPELNNQIKTESVQNLKVDGQGNISLKEIANSNNLNTEITGSKEQINKMYANGAFKIVDGTNGSKEVKVNLSQLKKSLGVKSQASTIPTKNNVETPVKQSAESNNQNTKVENNQSVISKSTENLPTIVKPTLGKPIAPPIRPIPKPTNIQKPVESETILPNNSTENNIWSYLAGGIGGVAIAGVGLLAWFNRNKINKFVDKISKKIKFPWERNQPPTINNPDKDNKSKSKRTVTVKDGKIFITTPDDYVSTIIPEVNPIVKGDSLTIRNEVNLFNSQSFLDQLDKVAKMPSFKQSHLYSIALNKKMEKHEKNIAVQNLFYKEIERRSKIIEVLHSYKNALVSSLKNNCDIIESFVHISHFNKKVKQYCLYFENGAALFSPAEGMNKEDWKKEIGKYEVINSNLSTDTLYDFVKIGNDGVVNYSDIENGQKGFDLVSDSEKMRYKYYIDKLNKYLVKIHKNRRKDRSSYETAIRIDNNEYDDMYSILEILGYCPEFKTEELGKKTVLIGNAAVTNPKTSIQMLLNKIDINGLDSITIQNNTNFVNNNIKELNSENNSEVNYELDFNNKAGQYRSYKPIASLKAQQLA